ncbi:hypothetical protein MGYG_04033 [Nannizzia gypsea CBS 118893]|uniref:Uncharacterized protein n=1 Tax=Arthroderma gypseum (strain ATCC MYA-4604 / CBS 118893) TaxID=535722 RepID=E4UUR3_ARTGP|nr:hypothetical protein MGYG_04033 [Nannizzia gypsea CBS 118893]EFR01030.1 hypothetical protein MGYG_04033 [Nannizzia gypsea CBS 118893]
MPVSTRMTNREQQDDWTPPWSDKGAGLYPVFCTANIPPEILDRFIYEAYAGMLDVLGEIDEVGPGAPCILETTDLDSITHGSRLPMKQFKSPFLGWTEGQVREWMVKHEHPNFASSTFTILDQNTIDRGISRMGYISEVMPDDRMTNARFSDDLANRVALEMCTLDWYNCMEEDDA